MKKSYFILIFVFQIILLNLSAQRVYFKLSDSSFKVNSILISNIHFLLGESEIRTESFGSLDSIAGFLEKNKKLIIEVRGNLINCKHTSTKKLSFQRAENIVKYIVSKGIPPKRLKATGCECEDPLFSKQALSKLKDEKEIEKALILNGRTEFKIIGLDQN